MKLDWFSSIFFFFFLIKQNIYKNNCFLHYKKKKKNFIIIWLINCFFLCFLINSPGLLIRFHLLSTYPPPSLFKPSFYVVLEKLFKFNCIKRYYTVVNQQRYFQFFSSSSSSSNTTQHVLHSCVPLYNSFKGNCNNVAFWQDD